MLGMKNKIEAVTVAPLSGGLLLPRNKPGIPVNGKIETLCLPAYITIPLWDYHRREQAPLVSVNERVEQGQLLSEGVISSCDGVVELIQPCSSNHASELAINSVVIKTQPNDVPFRKRYSEEKIISDERLAASAVYGLGGAGFNTLEKIKSPTKESVDTLIINAVECEPQISCDESLLIAESELVVTAIDNLTKKLDCKRCIIAIENDKQQAIAALTNAISQYDINAVIKLVKLDPVYPSGAEKLLVERITGQQLAANQHPSKLGILCLNVATVVAIEQARRGFPMVTRIVTIGGEQALNPTNVRVFLGTSVREVLKQTNNLIGDTSVRFRLGGPLSGFDLGDLDVPVTATTNSITVENAVTTNIEQPCIRCSACSDVCPVELMPQQLHPFSIKEDSAKLTKLGIHECIECGCCDAVCPSSIPLTHTFRYAKGLLKLERKQAEAASAAKIRFEKKEQRELARKQQKELKRAAAKSTQAVSVDPIADALARVKERRRKTTPKHAENNKAPESNTGSAKNPSDPDNTGSGS